MTVEHFDGWYGAMQGASARDELWQRSLGLPPEVVSTSLLPMEGLLGIAGWLALAADDVLLDLACGRGGYGMWLARAAGCRMVGVDFSAVAVAEARERMGDFGLAGRADFVVGDLVATGLADRSVDAALCVDAIQFAGPAAGGEMRRVLRPGGRVALSCWEPLDRDDPALPERLRRVDLESWLICAGFADVEVATKPEWTAVERELWQTLLDLGPGDDPGLQDARQEAESVSSVVLDRCRRVLATGRVPT